MDGSIWLGPNAVLAFAREGYSFFEINPPEAWDAITYPGFFKLAARYWKIGAVEMYRDLVRSAYIAALQRYVPVLRAEDCMRGPAGVRAQALGPDGSLVDDFVFEGCERVLHVRNAPSPGATSSLAIAKYIVEHAEKQFGLSSLAVPNLAGALEVK
jgi:2-hydroxyglutarate dehydrogenase